MFSIANTTVAGSPLGKLTIGVTDRDGQRKEIIMQRDAQQPDRLVAQEPEQGEEWKCAVAGCRNLVDPMNTTYCAPHFVEHLNATAAQCDAFREVLTYVAMHDYRGTGYTLCDIVADMRDRAQRALGMK